MKSTRTADLAFLFVLLALIAGLVLISCGDDNDDSDGGGPNPGDDDDSGDDDSGDSGGLPGWRIDFQFEYEHAGSLVFWEEGDSLVGYLSVSGRTATIEPGVVIGGTGRFVEFPESGYRALSMTLDGPATYDRCGAEPITYSLFATFRGENGFLYGGLTAYCGSGVTYGRPAQLMRWSGNLVAADLAPPTP